MVSSRVSLLAKSDRAGAALSLRLTEGSVRERLERALGQIQRAQIIAAAGCVNARYYIFLLTHFVRKMRCHMTTACCRLQEHSHCARAAP